jgi:hypothetical protein
MPARLQQQTAGSVQEQGGAVLGVGLRWVWQVECEASCSSSGWDGMGWDGVSGMLVPLHYGQQASGTVQALCGTQTQAPVLLLGVYQGLLVRGSSTSCAHKALAWYAAEPGLPGCCCSCGPSNRSGAS